MYCFIILKTEKSTKYRNLTLEDKSWFFHEFSYRGNLRDAPFENYIHKLKFPKIVIYRGYNTKYFHGEKSWFATGASNVNSRRVFNCIVVIYNANFKKSFVFFEFFFKFKRIHFNLTFLKSGTKTFQFSKKIYRISSISKIYCIPWSKSKKLYFSPVKNFLYPFSPRG